MKITTKELLEHSFVISIDDNRLRQFRAIFHAHGLSEPLPILWPGIRDKTKTPWTNCWLSHRTAIQRAKELGWPYVCMFEDDVYPRDGIKDYLDYYLSDIPDKCNLMILGHYRLFEFAKYDDKWYNHAASWGSHAYVLFKDRYDMYIKTLDNFIVCDSYQFDDSKFGPKDTVFMPNKNLFIQYCDKKSMTNYIGYLWNINGKNLSNEDVFKRGYSPIESILDEDSKKIDIKQRVEEPPEAKLRKVIVFNYFTGSKYNSTANILEWYNSMSEKYMVDCNRTFVVYTDNHEAKRELADKGIVFVDVDERTTQNINENLRAKFRYIYDYLTRYNPQFDYLCFIQSNARCQKQILLDQFTNGKDLTLCRHCDFNGSNFLRIYCDNSRTSVDLCGKDITGYIYIQAAHFAAKKDILMDICKFINDSIEIDRKNDAYTYFHDETYLNFYLNTNLLKTRKNQVNIADGWVYCHSWYQKPYDSKVFLFDKKITKPKSKK